jgi:hypothetical protein
VGPLKYSFEYPCACKLSITKNVVINKDMLLSQVVMQHAGRRSSKGMNNDPYTPLKHKSKAELTEVEYPCACKLSITKNVVINKDMLLSQCLRILCLKPLT